MSEPHLVVYNTCPDAETARSLAEHLVNSRAAACVNIVAGINSVYRWQGEVQTDEEYLLIIKTTHAAYATLEREIINKHPYDLPEIIALPVQAGLAPYLTWIDENTGS